MDQNFEIDFQSSYISYFNKQIVDFKTGFKDKKKTFIEVKGTKADTY